MLGLLDVDPAAGTCPAGSVALGLPKQLRQPRAVDGDPSRLVLHQHLRLPCFDVGVARVDVRECQPVGVSDDITAGYRVGWRGAGKRRNVIRGEEAETAGRRMASSSPA